MRLGPCLRTVLASVTVPTVIAAQAVWNVTSPTGIQAAIAAASPGDIIVLTPSGGFPDYEPFTLNKGVTIRGNGARVGPSPTLAWPGTTITIAIPAGEIAHLDQVDCSYGFQTAAFTIGCPIIISGGGVRIDRCVMRAFPATLTITGGDVVLHSSTMTTVPNLIALPYHGLVATGGSITLRDCWVEGSAGGCNPQTGCGGPWGNLMAGTAAVVSNAVLHAERTTFVGGNHPTTQFTNNGGHGIDATNSTVRLAHCTVRGGSSLAGNGGNALTNNSAIVADLRQTGLFPGAPTGSASTGPVNLAAPLTSLELQPVWTRGQASTLAVRGDAHALHGLWIVTVPSPSVSPLVVEPIWSSGATPVAFGILDASGQTTLLVAVPALASLLHTPVWCQAVSGTALPLRASTIAGGVVR